MIPVLSRTQMRAFDKLAIETCHVPGIVLMENAGRGAADIVCAMLDGRPPRGIGGQLPCAREAREQAEEQEQSAGCGALPRRKSEDPGKEVVVIAGTGNNGGDGFVVARHLLARGISVVVFLVGSTEQLTGDARTNHDAFVDLGGSCAELSPTATLVPFEAALASATLLVDAIFGTGLDRPVRGQAGKVISAINRSGTPCVALDVPSGLDADSGAPLGATVHADATVTFGHLKTGLLTPEGARLAGTIHVVDLGVPSAPLLLQAGHTATVIETERVAEDLLPREPSAHKHQAGDVLIVAGSTGKVGAAMLSGLGAMRAGAGLVTLATWDDALPALESRVVEIMTTPIDRRAVQSSLDTALARRTAVAIGPGLGLDQKARLAVDQVVLEWDGIKVVDADAITHFTGRAEDLLRAPGQCILTPHPGELGRLLGKPASAIEHDRFAAAREAVEKTRAIIVLKGARTIIATPDGRMYVNVAGNPALATAGSGDVLTGILVALACTLSPVRASAAAVLIHALAADLWQSGTGSDRGMLASEIAASVPEVMASLIRVTPPRRPSPLA